MADIFDSIRGMMSKTGGATDKPDPKKTYLDAKAQYDEALNNYQGMHNKSMNANDQSEQPDESAYDLASQKLDQVKRNMDKAHKDYISNVKGGKDRTDPNQRGK
jgi:hypothetical protein